MKGDFFMERLLFFLFFPYTLFCFQFYTIETIDTLQDVDWHVVGGAAFLHLSRPLEDYFPTPVIQDKTFENMKWYASVACITKKVSAFAPLSLKDYADLKLRFMRLENDLSEEGRKFHTVTHMHTDASGQELVRSLYDMLHKDNPPFMLTFLSEDRKEVEVMKKKAKEKGIDIFNGVHLKQKQWYNYKKDGPVKWWLNPKRDV